LGYNFQAPGQIGGTRSSATDLDLNPTRSRISVCGIIPARLESRRLPGKPLRLICGRPMIAWVYERALLSAVFDKLLIATDSEQIIDYCTQSAIPARLTSSLHLSGTDRLIEVMDQNCTMGQPADLYVNIQGDEPMVTADHLRLLLSPFFTEADAEGTSRRSAQIDGASGISSTPVQVSTLKVAITSEEAQDPNAVKVVTDRLGRALYFSRAPIPFNRGNSAQLCYYKHLGFYAYSVEALRRFRSLTPSALEQAECLEQLRFLENGIPIRVLETADDTIGVDTEHDLERVQEYFAKLGSASRL
jgi:3-deoxy-manno-octulosonate cytidylyltransferase (CMP-KDO synthetase)